VIHPGSLFDTCYVHYCCESLYFVSIKLIIIIKKVLKHFQQDCVQLEDKMWSSIGFPKIENMSQLNADIGAAVRLSY